MTENTITTTKGAATPETLARWIESAKQSGQYPCSVTTDYHEIKLFKKDTAVLCLTGTGEEITLEKEELVRLGSACLALAERMEPAC